MSYRWLGCDLISGTVIDELPIVATSLPLLIGALSTATVEMPIPDAPSSWRSATDPGRTLLVCVRDSDDAIVWGGIVTGRNGGSGPTLSIGLATPEAYLDRRYTPALTFAQADEAQIARDLVATAQVEGIGFVVDAPNTGTLRDRTYDETTDQTVYQQLTELSGVEGGPEWTVRLRWDPTGAAVEKVFTLRKRLGRASASPSAVFDFPGTVKDYSLDEGFTSDTGANHVEVFGDGEGESRPASAPARDEALIGAYPRFEIRETRSGVTVPTTLDEHARETLAFTRLGARTLTISADAATAPQYLTDWNLGDDVALQVAESYRHPDGLYVVGRVIGADFDPSPGGSVSPIVLFNL